MEKSIYNETLKKIKRRILILSSRGEKLDFLYITRKEKKILNDISEIFGVKLIVCDCFAYNEKTNKCIALNKLYCQNGRCMCNFYKNKNEISTEEIIAAIKKYSKQ